MTCCAEPGEILIFPHEGGYESFEPGKELELEPINSLEQVVVQAREEAIEEGRKVGELPGSRPWVARVPEHETERYLTQLGKRDDIRVASPNWRLSLASSRTPAEVNPPGFDPSGAFEFLTANCPDSLPRDHRAGEGRHVAVIDSGIAREAICCADALSPTQLDVAAFGSCWRSDPYDERGHGSLVAALVHLLAPSARVTSVRCFQGGTARLSDLVYGLLSVNMLEGPVDLVNLSLSVNAAVERCPNPACGYPSMGPAGRVQLEAVLDYMAWAMDPCPVFVAAGGTASLLAAPACIPGVIAVGSAEMALAAAPRSVYDDVGWNFVLAPGGSSGDPIRANPHGGQYGSSFSTAVVTGLLAQDRTGKLAEVIDLSWSDRVKGQQRLLTEYADRDYARYDPKSHGLGLIG